MEKYSSTARSRSSRPDTATILPLSLQENVRSPEQCRHLFWTLSAFMLNGMGGWLVSLVVVYFMSEYLTCWGPGLLRLGAIMSFGGYCVSRPGLLRLGAVVG